MLYAIFFSSFGLPILGPCTRPLLLLNFVDSCPLSPSTFEMQFLFTSCCCPCLQCLRTVITNARIDNGSLEALKGLPFFIVAELKSLD
jgi:hypothetical protein